MGKSRASFSPDLNFTDSNLIPAGGGRDLKPGSDYVMDFKVINVRSANIGIVQV